MDEKKEQVVKLLTEALQIGREEVTEELTFGDVPQWDSLGHMMVMAALEEKYGVEISTETIAELVNYKAIYSYIEKQSNGL
ncbi:MAG TPA: acyl carrier protein [Anaerolineales bacterium]